MNYLPRREDNLPTRHRRFSEISNADVDRGEDVLIQSTTIDINNLNINASNDGKTYVLSLINSLHIIVKLDSDNYSYSDYQVEQPGPSVPRTANQQHQPSRTQRQNAQAEPSTAFRGDWAYIQ